MPLIIALLAFCGVLVPNLLSLQFTVILAADTSAQTEQPSPRNPRLPPPEDPPPPRAGPPAIPPVTASSEVRPLPTQTVTLSGTVATIDHEKRTVNIRKADGSFEAVDVPPSAKRFDELKVGDKVSITYNNNVSARLKPPGEAPVNTQTGTSTAGQGERPGGTASVQKTLTATVEAIDKNASSITFVGPNGWKYTRHIVDPSVLDKVKVGDKADITWNTDVTVSVQ
jgi:hypothetical protein